MLTHLYKLKIDNECFAQLQRVALLWHVLLLPLTLHHTAPHYDVITFQQVALLWHALYCLTVPTCRGRGSTVSHRRKLTLPSQPACADHNRLQLTAVPGQATLAYTRRSSLQAQSSGVE